MADPKRYGAERVEAYRIAHALSLRIDKLTDSLAPPERFHRGEQIRRSAASVPTQFVEGYGLRKYKDQFLHYLHRALASADETKEHLDQLYRTGKLKSEAEYNTLEAECRKLSAKLGAFIKGVERNHTTPYYLRQPPKADSKPTKRRSRRGGTSSEPGSDPDTNPAP